VAVDFTLRVDAIVSTIALLGGGFYFAGGVNRQLGAVAKTQDKLEGRLEKIETSLVTMAEQKVQIADLERRVGKLEG
jgi:hypothetical protein